jgi:carbamate kinase
LAVILYFNIRSSTIGVNFEEEEEEEEEEETEWAFQEQKQKRSLIHRAAL